ncbi:unnamed protein product [Meganyctiphanes norvegica]|uniref:phospholipase D n=1 Tax=Meganyctiphanes norvegica TaxID=48144 RepID=A0AAV2QJR5_MEGNR
MDVPAAEGAEAQPILAYVGGLDVTDGRWDTPDHVLFRSLLDNHKDDFYNGCVQTTPEVGPRQPWHDIHARVEGPVAKDVLDNFTERWRHQVKEKEYRLLPMGDELDFSALAEVEEGSEWNAQLFRSITSDSAAFDLNRIQYVPKRKIKNVDDSILRAYIHHIRKADHFMFFENQYFLGSAFNWEDEVTTKAHHLIPQEITHRICDKISAGEHIVAYIIIPIHPEGDPTTDAVQAILHCQHRTMEMMYKKIATTIKKKKLETKPTDYLTFFCLGKGECSDDIPAELPKPEPGTPGARLRETARFMIYVHSKIMIIDDDYILVGSANINQRSMVGTRETEIAVGAYQPLHTSEVSGYPRGSVHQFRMALWAEHLNGVEEVHANPGTLECVKAVNQLATKNWEQFVTDEPCHITGHLLHYPVNVNDDGSVTALKDFPNFPNTEAPILGAPILESRPKAYHQMKTHHSHPIVNKISQISQPITAVSVPYREQHDWAK